ncbi:MAG: hypothetical protein ACR2MU_03375 [Gaiellaceae bacterium]
MRVPPHHDPACWGCGDDPGGIHLPLPDAERLERGPGIVLGGLVSAARDEEGLASRENWERRLAAPW